MDEELRAWVLAVLGVSKVTATRSRPWADIWRIEARHAVWWLKVNKAGTVHEPALLRLLAGLGSALIPTAHTHPHRPWSLVADAGQPVRDLLATSGRATTVRFWSDLLAEYAELQRRTSAEELLAVGLADFSAPGLPGRFAELLAQTDWFGPPAVTLDAGERDRIAALEGQISVAAAELADGVAATVQHDDLHDSNVLVVAGDLRDPRVIDWGDAVYAHPFGTLRLTLDSLREELSGREVPGTDVEPDLDRITSAYLEGWRIGGTTEQELRRQVRLARWLECISRSACWIRALGSIEVGVTKGYASSPSGWLQMMADEAADLEVSSS